jgi:hypothetical protein
MKVHLAVRLLLWSVARSLVLVCIVLAPAYAASVYGVAQNPEGKPLASCTFSVLASSGEQIREVKTDASGRYTVFLQPGIYAVRVGSDLEGVLQALVQPSRQDIRFRRRKV